VKKVPAIPNRLPLWLQWLTAGILGFIFVILPFHAFLSTWGGTAIGPLEVWKSWKEVLLAAATIPLLAWLCLRPRRLRALLSDRLSWWLLGFAGYMTILALIHVDEIGQDATLAGLAMNGRYLLAFVLSYILFWYGTWTWELIKTSALHYLIGMGVFVALLGIIQVTLLPNDFLTQFGYDKETTIAPVTVIDDNPNAPRAFATLRGPNDFGAFLILPIIASLVAARKNPRLLIATVLLLVALYFSSSRSAWLGVLVAAAILAWLLVGKRLVRQKTFIIASLVALVVGAGLLAAAINISSIRLAVFHSSPSDTSLTEGSTDDHWTTTAGGIQRVLSDPLGCGPGCSGPASYYGSSPKISENYYVQIAEETGIIGLVLWIGIVWTVGVRLWRQRSDKLATALLASLVGICVIGVWLHVWSDDPLSLTWWLLAGATLGHFAQVLYSKQKHYDRQTQKNTRQVRN